MMMYMCLHTPPHGCAVRGGVGAVMRVGRRLVCLAEQLPGAGTEQR